MKALLLSCLLATPLVAAEKSNIVLIMVDDMGYSDIRPWGGEINTPNSDALAKSGGVSLTPAFDGKPLVRNQPIFIEHENNAFVRDGDWKLVGKGVSMPRGLQKLKWELYKITEDGTELNNLAKDQPEKVPAMSAQWQTWAKRAQVFPKVKPQTKSQP